MNRQRFQFGIVFVLMLWGTSIARCDALQQPAPVSNGGGTNYSPEELDATMVRVPAGPFLFGMTDAQKSAAAAAAHVHADMLRYHSSRQVLATKEFWLDKYPVTRGQFLRFLKASGYKVPYNGWLVGWRELLGDPFADADKLAWPMTGVNSEDAAAYAKWIGKRLPTEIEWEKAARGTDGRLYPWGNAWKDSACYRNPGNIPLGAGFPVGSFPDGASPYGAMDMAGCVLQWVKWISPPVAEGAEHADPNAFYFAGSSPLHEQPYTHMATNRLAWSKDMRIYNGGFRCVADERPRDLVAIAKYAPPPPQFPQAVKLRPDLFLKKSIRLEPQGCATFKIHVPWFPESVWAVDSPEGRFEPFGGANDWPRRNESEWKIDWKVEDGGRRISYVREKAGKKLSFAAWVDGAAVEYWMSGENMKPLDLAAFCFKTFSPFFSSQERMTQNRLEGDGLVRCCDLPQTVKPSLSFGWTVGDTVEPGAAIFKAYEGPAYLMFVGVPGVQIGGNGWVPCTHLRGLKRLVEKSGGGRIVFWIGPLEGAKKYVKYP